MQKPLDIDPVFREQFERRKKRRRAFKWHRRIFLAVTISATFLIGYIQRISSGGITHLLEPAAGVLFLWLGFLILHALDVYVVLDRLDRRRTQAKYDKLKREFEREMAAANAAGSALEEKAKAKPKRGMVTIGDDGELVYPGETEDGDTMVDQAEAG